MSEEEKFIRNKIEECTRIIEASSCIENKKAYAKERTQLKYVLNLIQKQQAELEKKDKIIDEMADELWEEFYLTYIKLYNIRNKEELKQCFERKVKNEFK